MLNVKPPLTCQTLHYFDRVPPLAPFYESFPSPFAEILKENILLKKRIADLQTENYDLLKSKADEVLVLQQEMTALRLEIGQLRMANDTIRCDLELVKKETKALCQQIRILEDNFTGMMKRFVEIMKRFMGE
jgi:predicted nuclease with TOPRIM domain